MRLAIIVSHPIQYYVPVYKQLSMSDGIELHVFFTWDTRDKPVIDRGFNKKITWDIPLLDGYSYTFIKNISKTPGTHHFFGLVNPELNQSIIDWAPNVVVVIGYKYFSHLNAIINITRKNIPVLLKGDSHLVSPRPLYVKLAREIFLKWIFKRLSGVLYCGILNKEYFKHFGIKEERLFFSPHAIENSRFYKIDKNQELEINILKNKLKIKSGDLVVLYSGKLQKKKNPKELLFAFQKVSVPNAILIFVGDGELEKELKGLSNTTNNNVRFLQFQNQSMMPVVYRIADIFVLPSIYDETWGLSINEAMCCGLPVIVSDQVGCAPDLVKHNINGWIYRAGDIDELTSLLRTALLNKQKLVEMGMQSREIIKNWDIKQASDGIINACKSVYRDSIKLNRI